VYQRISDFLEKNGAAAMITLRADGTPHAVRVGVTLVDGEIWSSAVESRARTRFLRRDPRSTLYLQDTQTPYGWMTLETKVHILDGPDAPALNLRLFRVMQKKPEPAPISWFGRDMTEPEFLEAMRAEGRLVYQFEVLRAYGMTDASGAWSWRT
jgi:PPOX class probable F420-dependent enzyme